MSTDCPAMGARAEKRVTEELVKAFKRVTGKENILFQVAEAALATADGPVREVGVPAVRGGYASNAMGNFCFEVTLGYRSCSPATPTAARRSPT
jgi:hypothetical protein